MPAPRAASIRVLVLDNLVGLKIPSKLVKQLMSSAAMLINLELLSLQGCGIDKVRRQCQDPCAACVCVCLASPSPQSSTDRTTSPPGTCYFVQRHVALGCVPVACGVCQLEPFRFKRLVQCYLDGNKLSNLKTVMDFVSASPVLEDFSMAANPLSMAADWPVRSGALCFSVHACGPRPLFDTCLSPSRPRALQTNTGRLLARLPHVRTLNRDPVPSQGLLLAVRRFGNADDQRAVAMRLFSDTLADAATRVRGARVVCSRHC